MGEKQRDNAPENIPVRDFLAAHAKSGNGVHGFFRSNLFNALVVFVLSQAVLIGGTIMAMYWRISSVVEWKGTVDSTLKRMDESGTIFSANENKQHEKDITHLETRIEHLEQDTRHIEVIESEHRRLTNDVEELKRRSNGQK